MNLILPAVPGLVSYFYFGHSAGTALALALGTNVGLMAGVYRDVQLVGDDVSTIASNPASSLAKAQIGGAVAEFVAYPVAGALLGAAAAGYYAGIPMSEALISGGAELVVVGGLIFVVLKGLSGIEN